MIGESTAIFWPMIAHFALVALVYVLLTLKRTDAVKAGNADVKQFRENQIEPSESQFVRNNLENQFELPIFFHVVCIALYVTDGASFYTVLLAWFFAISRYVHAFFHIRENIIVFRSRAFAAGFMLLGLMWLAFTLHLVTLGLL